MQLVVYIQVRKNISAKICRDDYAKKYSNKVYIGMAVCKGRGDDINTKLNWDECILHVFEAFIYG